MATDLYFNTATREMVIENGDFALISNTSTQKGNIIQYSRGAFVNTPALGVGMESIINANTDKLAYEMSRWQSQTQADGAKFASWDYSVTDVQTNQIQINTKVNYE